MVSMVGCGKDADRSRVRVRTRARAYRYGTDHVDHVRPFISYYYHTPYAFTWSVHGLVCSQSSKESFNTGTKGAMVKTFGIKTQGT